jgi:hypothetical protein
MNRRESGFIRIGEGGDAILVVSVTIDPGRMSAADDANGSVFA